MIKKILSSLILTSAAFGATVKKTNPAKGLITVVGNEGDTFTQGSIYCVHISPIEQECGSITKLKGQVAVIKLDNKKAAKSIKNGMIARPSDGRAKSSSLAAQPVQHTRLYAVLAPSAILPYEFHNPEYVAPETSTPESLWKDGATIKNTVFGIALSGAFPVGPFAINPGFRYRKTVSSELESNYDPNHINPYVSSTVDSTELGLWLDFEAYRLGFGERSGISLTSGLDFDNSTVTLKATKKDDNEASLNDPIAKATSKLSVISFRVGSAIDFVFYGPFGVTFGTNILVPLAAVSPSFSGDVVEGGERGSTNTSDSLKKTIGHKKASIAADVTLGTVFAF